MSRTPLIVANWKMNHSVSESIKFITNFSKHPLSDDVEVVICPPATSLYSLKVAVGDESRIKLGAQNCHSHDSGAYTGEISASFLKDLCQYVIVGHSERRHIFNESNEFLAEKLKRCLENKLTPIFCVGEKLEEREAGQTNDVIQKQLDESLADIQGKDLNDFVIAYEPVWAIGTGKTATPEMAQEVHDMIREHIAKKFGTGVSGTLRILYGGSVKPENAHDILKQNDIDGVLVGGASLDPESYYSIVTST